MVVTSSTLENLVKAEIKTVDDVSKIAVTSLRAGDGTALVTANDDANHTATISVSVASDGTVTIGTINKYSSEAVTATLTGVSITGSESIQYDASNVPLTAVPEGVTEGVSYEWEITTSTAGATLDTNTGAVVKLSVNNTASEEVTVSVKVTATYGETTKNATKNITVSAHGVEVKDEVTGVAITGTGVAEKAVTIAADGQIALTASATSTGSPTITYAWEVTDADSVIASKSGESTATLTLTASNTATANKTVTVKVTASDGTNNKSDEVTVTVSGKIVTVYDLTDEGTNVDGAITGEINLGYGEAYEGNSAVKDADKKEYNITKGADKLAYVKVTNGNNVWAVKNFGTEDDSKEIEALELKSGRSFAVDVKNVSAFEVIAFTTDITRKIAVKVDSGDLVEYAAETASVPFSTGLIITGSTGNHTITITNTTSNTVYAGYIKLYNEAAALAGVKAQWESLLAGYTGDNEAKGKAEYYWQGGEAVASAVAKTPSTFNDYAAAITALNTAAANAVVYVKPTAITVKTKDTDKEIETGTAYEHSRLASATLALVASEDEGATGKLTWSLTSAGDTGATLDKADDGTSATLKTLTANGTVTITVSDTDSRASGLNKVITINVTAEEVKVAANDEITVTADKTATGIGSKITLSATPTKAYTEKEVTGKWYKKVGEGEETGITLTDGVYTTIAEDIGSVVFTYKLTGAKATATANTEAVSVNFHVTKAGTVWNVADYVGTSTSLSADTHDIGGVSYKSTASTTIATDSCTDGDRSFTKCIQTGGTGSTTNRVFSFYVDAAAKISVYCKTGGSGERKIVLNNVEQAAPSTAGKLDFEVNAAGTYTMYASTSCYIYGMYVSATSDIKFTQSSVDVGTGKSLDLSTLLSNKENKTVTYALAAEVTGVTLSGNTLSVAENALNGIEEGKTVAATVNASTADGDTATITVNVVENKAVESISFGDVTEVEATIGSTTTLPAPTFTPSDATNKTVTWSIPTGVTGFSVDAATGVVTVESSVAKDTTAVVQATTEDGGKSATITVKAVENTGPVGLLSFSGESSGGPNVVKNELPVQFTIQTNGVDYYPSTGKMRILKGDSSMSIKFTTPGTTSDTYSMVIEGVFLSTAKIKINNGDAQTLEQGDSVLGTKDNLGGKTTTATFDLKGGTEYTVARSAGNPHVYSVTITKK